MARNLKQENFSWELTRRNHNIHGIGGNYYNDYADASVSLYKGNLNQALEEIASITRDLQTFDKSAVHIWQVRAGNEPSWAFKLPHGTQLRDLLPSDLYVAETEIDKTDFYYSDFR